MNLVELCYRVTASFPRAETFELARQLRRSAMSIPSNVAEGHSRRSTGAYVNHLGMSLGSQAELETQIELSRRLGFLTSAEARKIKDLTAQVARLLQGLMRALEARNS